MKTKIKLIILTILLLNISCKKEDSSVDEGLTIFILDSKIENNKGKGFLFESLKIIDYPNSDNIKPDFSVLAQTNDTGYVIGPFLSNPDMTKIFKLTREFSNLDSAQSFFNSYAHSTDTIYNQFALNIQPFQIWTIKTNTGDNGKILVIETKGEEINNTPFAEIKFKADRLN